GNVTAESAVIGGGILGNVEVTDKIELTNTAKVLGDITTSVIVIDESAIFQGKCNMHQSVPDRQAKNKSAKAMKESKKSAKAALAEALKELQEAENKELQERSAAQADNGKNNSNTAKTGAV
ncbi:MAG: polymer-forming cytoskeletal protein, partial [Acetatifactor sp.]|nr:polymer-forming cytoskeletal protein [Acetatifactor sp.]